MLSRGLEDAPFSQRATCCRLTVCVTVGLLTSTCNKLRYEAFPHRVQYDLGRVVETQLLHQICAVGFDG